MLPACACSYIGVAASIDLFLVKGGAQGKLTFDGALGLADPNSDGKLRFSEIIEILEEGDGAR